MCIGTSGGAPNEPLDFPYIADLQSAFRAAETIAGLEVRGAFFDLYRAMHPDARAVIPAPAVIGWYTNEYLHYGEPAPQAIKIRFTPWTWEVTGKTYAESAEVATKQILPDGNSVWDAVRLVKDHQGSWCWFFGKDRRFVIDQINRFVPASFNTDERFSGDWGFRLGEPCSATIDCSQAFSPANCVETLRDGLRQRVCLYGPNGYCSSNHDCHQEDGPTECVGETQGGYFHGVCLRAVGATCKSPRDCMESLTCVTGLCTPAA